MNIAFPAIIVFALLFPGFVARSQFKRAERALLDYSPFGQVVAQAVAWACALHLLWLFAAYYVLDQRLDTSLLLGLLTSGAEQQTSAIKLLATRDEWLAIYFGTMLAFVYLVPALARRAISHWRLDRARSPLAFVFRFTKAPWYYLLTGADFDAADEPDLIYVAAIVNAAGTATLYTGELRRPVMRHAGLDMAQAIAHRAPAAAAASARPSLTDTFVNTGPATINAAAKSSAPATFGGTARPTVALRRLDRPWSARTRRTGHPGWNMPALGILGYDTASVPRPGTPPPPPHARLADPC